MERNVIHYGSAGHEKAIYKGDGLRFCTLLSGIVYGGQVVFSEGVWASVQDRLPQQLRVRASPLSTHE